jgi:hypothetical protein
MDEPSRRSPIFTLEDQRIADFLADMGLAGGADPVAFLLSSYRRIHNENIQLRRDARGQPPVPEAPPASNQPPGYHVRSIAKGVLGEASKVMEEAEEFADAVSQGVSVMALVELSDLYGAVESYLATQHPSITMADLAAMSATTKRAFTHGHRQ